MGLFGRAGTRAHGADRSPVRSRTDAGACSRVRSRTSAGVRSRVRRGYGLVAARENSLGSCRWRILSVDASLICRRCGSHRLVKTFVVPTDYPRRRTLALLLDYPRCRTLCLALLLDYPRCRTLCSEVLLDHPRCRCSPSSLRHHLHCQRQRHHLHCQRLRHHLHRHRQHRHHRRRHPVPSRACSYRPRAPRRELSRGISLSLLL